MDYQAVGAGVVSLILGGIAAWQSTKANRNAAKANTQTKATGNGFAKHVTDDLAELKAQVKTTNSLLVQHLADHAGHDLDK